MMTEADWEKKRMQERYGQDQAWGFPDGVVWRGPVKVRNRVIFDEIPIVRFWNWLKSWVM